jgi:hypothetical protein
MKHYNLNEKNVLLYAMQHYDSPDVEEEGVNAFDQDWKHVKYVRRLLNRYQAEGDLKERLILNHIIVLNNVFGTEPAVRILFAKIPAFQWSELKTFLVYLGYMPQVVKDVHGINILESNVGINSDIAQKLREL